MFSCKDSKESVFTEKTYQDTIIQNIGGVLIREIHYSDDFTSADYDIKYSYKNNRDIIQVIGNGSYYSQQPPDDEQLMRFDKWTLFKTSAGRDKDIIFIYDSISKNWTEYEVSPETIESEELWRVQNLKTRIDNWDAVSKVTKIDSNGNITVFYTFVNEKFIPFFKTGKRNVIYSINKETGRLEMTKITGS